MKWFTFLVTVKEDGCGHPTTCEEISGYDEKRVLIEVRNSVAYTVEECPNGEVQIWAEVPVNINVEQTAKLVSIDGLDDFAITKKTSAKKKKPPKKRRVNPPKRRP